MVPSLARIFRFQRRALLVEDNPMIRDNLVAALAEMANVQVIATADTEEQAVRWLTENAAQVDLVILDLMLAQGSGIGVLHALRHQRLRAPVVVLTNYATQDIRERCLELGAAAMFDKSQEVDDFLAFCHSATPIASAKASASAKTAALKTRMAA